jgi:hypothetical protein
VSYDRRGVSLFDHQMIDYVRVILLTGFIIAFVGGTIWRRRVAKKAANWPCVEGTIESGKLEQVAGGGRMPKVILPVFAFSYRVDGEYYSGRFALLPYITDPFVADGSFVEHMIGRKVQVNHDPLKPGVWFISDKLIEGCKVEQKFSRDWIDYAPPR